MSSPINDPSLWQHLLPRPAVDGHKYHRGYAAVLAAPELTGATRLAVTACNRIGAGLVSVIAEQRSDVYRTSLPADIMVQEKIPEKTSVCLGGSGGIVPSHLDYLLRGQSLKARIFDADAMPTPQQFKWLDHNCILTPHFGEFQRAFGNNSKNSDDGEDIEHLTEAARDASRRSGAVLVLKLPKTVIAHPDGRTIVNHHTSPYLAKAGTGDVLAGLICGLVAQSMPPFEASAAAVWIHGEAALRFGPGLIASDIAGQVPGILQDLLD